MPRGYPRSRFDVIDRTQVQSISTTSTANPTAVIMATYTSDKGSEDWEYMYGLTQFTDTKGGINFDKHGQAQLLVAEILRNGCYVLGKRMVSANATLANVTIKARTVLDQVSKQTYLYVYATSAVGVKTLKEAADAGYGDFDPTATNNTDFPLFTIAATGRGASNIFLRIVPEYDASKSASNTIYSFEVWENSELIESVVFTMNPEVIIDDVSQSIQAKINDNSQQIRCKLFEDGMFGLVSALSKTANIEGAAIPISELVTMDFINGKARRGISNIDGIVAEDPSDTDQSWTNNIPSTTTTTGEGDDAVTTTTADIVPITLSNNNGIPLTNGSYGTMGSSPMSNQAEYTKLLLGAWGKIDNASLVADQDQFDPIIYDLDAYKPDAVIDCGFPIAVKNAIIDVCDFRGDMIFLADLGTNGLKSVGEIIVESEKINPSRYCAVYHNYFNIINPYTKKDITVTMPFLLAKKLVKHITNGIGRPFAGFANALYFPEIIRGTVNFLPVTIPNDDQKQTLADARVNYISYYDGTPIMETMYTNNDEYTQLSYLHNIMAIQEVIKVLRSVCPRSRYTFLDGNDLDEYLVEADQIVRQYSTNFRSISIQYMADEKYETNNIFYATIVVQFRNFIQEEYFKIFAIS